MLSLFYDIIHAIKFIQKSDFYCAEDIYKILDSRVIHVSAIESITESDSPVISTSNNTYQNHAITCFSTILSLPVVRALIIDIYHSVSKTDRQYKRQKA